MLAARSLPHFMNHPIESANPAVRAIVEGKVPPPALLAAARGALPLPQADLLEVLVSLANSADENIAGHARTTLSLQETGALAGIIRSGEAAAAVVNFFGRSAETPTQIQELIITSPKASADTLVSIASSARSPQLLELIAGNQQLLIKNPAVIQAVLDNPHRSSEAERRVIETRREFFEKERGAEQIASELRAQGNQAAAEFFEKADLSAGGLSREDALFIASLIEVPDDETDDSWLSLDLIEDLYEETPEQRQAIVDKIVGEIRAEDDQDAGAERISAIVRILRMGIKDRMRLAMKGDREARTILIRDPNRLISTAVVSNPRITENEVEKIAAMRTVNEDVLRQIASDRQLARNYAIIHNLARNPRTPIANVMNILTRLQLRDLIALSNNRNVSDAVRRQALRISAVRKGR